MLRFLRARTFPGIEEVDAGSYARAFGPIEAPGWFRVSAWSRKVNALRLELCCQRPSRILEIVTRVRRMFDLDADPQIIAVALADDVELGPLVRARPGTRLPGAWDGFEAAVGSVLANTEDRSGNDVSTRVLSTFGDPVDLPAQFSTNRLFPTPEGLADADLAGAGIDRHAAAMIGCIARSLRDGRVDFDSARTLGDFVDHWSALPGIDRRIAHDIALRALGHPDAFPIGGTPADARRDAPGSNDASPGRLEKAQRWRPWRAYAFIHLMNASGTG
jgi:AraC family transcriptional regulator of adaptative response / DNA-3-methyladenine glycosylase II